MPPRPRPALPRAWRAAVAGALGLLLAAGLIGPPGPTWAAAMQPEPLPTVPAPSASAAPALATVSTTIPDRADRQWPLHPPWDACPRPTLAGPGQRRQPRRRPSCAGDRGLPHPGVPDPHRKGMRASGWTPTFRCWGSRRLDWGIDQVRRSRELDQLPSVVMIAMGTNDISWETESTTEARVRTLLRELGTKRQVLWVDLHLTRSAWLDARADWFNGLLRRLAKERPNLTVVPWHQVARSHGIRGWDGIHYGASGYRLRATTVVQALNRVGRAHPVPVLIPTPVPPPAPTEGPAASPSPMASASGVPSPSPTATPLPSPSG